MEESTLISPRIKRISWGHVEVEGLGRGKDFKLYPGGGREWDWGETGTRHEPGIQPSDVQELLDQGARVVVLSRGMLRRLQVCPETLDLLVDNGIVFHIEETQAAVKLYNWLTETEPVGGLFHSTC
ncbi:MAG: MTH938/NDUFAF3 family protein [Pseudomonadota bacterium]|nr:MTH938/NDUFAF3 family protein [Pseudomonadota bacterium]